MDVVKKSAYWGCALKFLRIKYKTSAFYDLEWIMGEKGLLALLRGYPRSITLAQKLQAKGLLQILSKIEITSIFKTLEQT